MPPVKKAQTNGLVSKEDFVNIRGLAMYAKLHEPTPLTELEGGIVIEPRWEVDILVTETHAESLLEKGFKVREATPNYLTTVRENNLDEKGYAGRYIRASKSTLRKSYDKATQQVRHDEKGKPIMEAAPMVPIKDSANNLITDPDFRIGNLSEVTARVSPTIKAGARKDFGARLVQLTIHEYVPYVLANKAGSFVFGETPAMVSQEGAEDAE